ncbi:penicillin-binding protein, partial [Halalkalibacillus sediminis]
MSDNGSKNKFLAFFQEGKFPTITRITLDVTWNVLLFFLVIGLVGGFFVGGLGLGYFASLVDERPVEDQEEMEQLVYNYEETSEIYFANNVFMGDFQTDIVREEIELSEVSQHLRNAIIATEDEYFKEHKGVVPKAIMRALYQEFTNAANQTGGSTLTQQLVKNQILTNEVSFERKAKEILVALRLENYFEKDEILEAYLNVVPFGRDSSGRNIAGVQAAAQGLFDVDADELNIPQAAYIAGLPQSPSIYTPFMNGGGVKSQESLEEGLDRMETVLDRMLRAEYITEDEYNEAMNYDVIGNLTDKKEQIYEDYPFLASEINRRAVRIMSKELALDEGITEEEFDNDSEIRSEYRTIAARQIKQNGYEFHTTIDKEIYDVFQEKTAEYTNFGPTKTIQVYDPETQEPMIDEETGETMTKEVPIEVGASLIDNETGRIIAFVGGRDYEESQFNRFSQHARPIGSTAKPLIGYGPGIELGLIHPGSPLPDVKFEIQPPGMTEPWSPSNYISGQENGLTSARDALKRSDNIPAGRLMLELLEKDGDPARFLQKMGVPYAQNNYSNVLGTDYITVEDNTNAYTTFANQGQFKDAFMIDKIVDRDGETIYQKEVEPVEVFSPQTAYLTTDMMRDVISSGTAVSLKSYLTNPGVDWAGKTGTSQGFLDAWFVGTNPNVTLGTWYGFRQNDIDMDGFVSEWESNILNLNNCPECSVSYSNRNLGLWADLANAATEIDPELMAPEERHASPGGIVSREYCQISGKLPSDTCRELGLVKTDLFNVEQVPTEEDDSITSGDFVTIEEKTYEALEVTPEEFTESGAFLNPDFLDEMGWVDIEDMSELLPDTDIWDDLVAPEPDPPADNGSPSAPGGVSISGGTLSWNSVGGDVIGYRVFRAKSRGGSFTQIDSTTETSADLPSKGSIYAVRAVDFYGNESALSSREVFGSLESDDDEEDESTNRDDNQSSDNDNDNDDSGGDGSGDDGSGGD